MGSTHFHSKVVSALATCAAVGLSCSAAYAQDAAAPVATAAPQTFDIFAFDVVGVKALPQEAVEAAVYPFAGPAGSAERVEGARKALEEAYKARGMESVLVEIPPQANESFVQGVLLLKVTEAPVGRLRVTGSRYHALSVIRKQVPSLQEGKVPDLRLAQAELEEANRFPDRQITPSIKAGKIPGTIDIDLRVRDELPLHASAEINNDHSVSTEALRTVVSARYTNLWQQGHSISATYLVSPENRKQISVFSGSYTAPLIGTPLTLLAFGYVSNSNIGSLGGTRVLGDGYSVGARAILRLPTPAGMSASISFGADYKDFTEDITVPSTEPNVPDAVIKTPVAYVPASATLSVQRQDDKSVVNVSLGITAGIRGLGASQDANRPKRFNSVGNFVRLNLDADLTYSFPADIVAALKLAGQFSDSPLVSNEQFAVGGAQTVRGYFQSEGVGDDGVVGSLELRSPSIAPLIAPFIDEWRAFAFIDAGYARVRSPLPDQQRIFRLASVGAGTRIQLLRHLSGSLAFGLALRDGPNTDRGDGQAVFSVRTEF